MTLILDEHRLYLSDLKRTALLRRAISAVIKPGDVVLDLACGTGVLGLLALKAGAARVYQVDYSPMIEVARELAAVNGYAHSTFAIHQQSDRATLPEKADIVVADQLSHFGIGAGMPEIFNDARRRLLKPGARAIPRRFELFIAPVNFPAMARVAGFWDKKRAGFKMAPARVIALNTIYPSKHGPQRRLASPARMAAFDLTTLAPERFNAKATIAVSAAGVMHGLIGWFVAELAPGVTMTNSPFSRSRIDRSAAFFPIERPITLSRGDSIRVSMTAITSENLLSWKVAASTINGREKARFEHSTLKGMLLMPDELAKTRPDFVPRLSDWGLARRSVIKLANGTRTLADIEKEMLRIHPNLFATLAQASAYVTKVLLPDARPD